MNLKIVQVLKVNHTDAVDRESVHIVQIDVIDRDVLRAKEVHPKNVDTVNVLGKEVVAVIMKVEVHIVMEDQEVAIVMCLEQVELATVIMITTMKGN